MKFQEELGIQATHLEFVITEMIFKAMGEDSTLKE